MDLGADMCGFLSWILLVIAGFRWIINGFEWSQLDVIDLVGFSRI